MKKILITFGTRPEVIKLAPVIRALEDHCQLSLLFSGQHEDLVDPLLTLFELSPDHRFNVMKTGQDLFELTSTLFPLLKSTIAKVHPDYVMVQGDTATAYLTALAAFYLQVPVLHVEAGLRSHDPNYPFPEEMYRKQISDLAGFHFAPTALNKDNLILEGISEYNIAVTGNTVIDTLHYIQEHKDYKRSAPSLLKEFDPDDEIAVLTVHRRENLGTPLSDILKALKQLLANRRNLKILFPVHPNPRIRDVVDKAAIKDPRFICTEPLPYISFLHMLQRANLLLTDSGGIQEEATALGKAVLVLREETERQELIQAGYGKLVGSDPSKILIEAKRYLDSGISLTPNSLFGDGTASLKIAEIILHQL